MKRKLFAVCCMMMLWMAIAQAEPYIYSSHQLPLVYFDCEDFDDEIPAQLDGVFGQWMEDGDDILCGTVCTTRYHKYPQTALSADALLAILRDGKILLLGAAYTDGIWRSAVETDSFFVSGQRFDVTCLPRHGMDGSLVGVLPALVCGGGEFVVRVHEDARVTIERYQAVCLDGSELSVCAGSGSISASRVLDGIEQESGRATGVFGGRLRSWTYDTFPKTCVQVNHLDGAGMPVFEEGEVLIFGVNLRERPTGQSPSLGKYTAIVRILDRAEGKQAPWYQVQWDDKIGWVSGDYVLFPENEDHHYLIALNLSEELDK